MKEVEQLMQLIPIGLIHSPFLTYEKARVG
jgi:hypothetical protein